MAAGKLISREELLGGFGGGDKRRAAIAFSLIQARAARLAVERGSVKAPFMTESAFKERNLAFLDAISETAKATARVSIQDLERGAPLWQVLVPANPAIRAEIAQLLGKDYRFARSRIPQIAAALGLDDPAVSTAFQDQQGRPLDTIYQTRTAPLEVLRWTWTRFSAALESLPPFWTAFALTLTEVVGAGTLALPIAFASVGPLAGGALLLLVGLINVLTVGYLAEASARNGSILYGSAFIGQLVRDFLSPFAVLIVRLGLFCFCSIVLVAFYTGFATTFAEVTGLPDPIWVFVICGLGVFLILRNSLIGTVASALLIGFINITILVILSLMAFGHASWERLTYVKVPFLFGEPFDASILQLVFGIAMVSYFGHVSVSNCAQAVLRRQADGRSLKTGTMAAMVVAIAIYTLWAVSIGGAVKPERLASEKGTVLVPLAEQVGLGVPLLGTAFVLLAMGMGSVHFSLGIYNMAREVMSGGRSARPRLRALRLVGSRKMATVMALVPIFLIFAYVQWSFLTEQESFIKPLELLGVLVTPLLAGLMPVLILIASRRRGRAIGRAKLPWLLANPIVMVFIALFSFAGIVSHALFIWEDPIKQAVAIFAAVVMLIFVVDVIRKNAFVPQWLIELRHFPEESDRAEVAVACNGKAVPVELTCRLADGTERKTSSDNPLTAFSTYRSLSFTLPERQASNLEVAAHKVSADFEAEAIAGELIGHREGTQQQVVALDQTLGRTRVYMPKGNLGWQLRLL